MSGYPGAQPPAGMGPQGAGMGRPGPPGMGAQGPGMGAQGPGMSPQGPGMSPQGPGMGPQGGPQGDEGGFLSRLKNRVFKGDGERREDGAEAQRAADAMLFPWLSAGAQGGGVPSVPVVTPFDSHTVFVMRPGVLEHKRRLMTMDGGHSLQVLARFEKVLTRFKAGAQDDALSTRELLESTNLLWHQAQAKISALKRDMASRAPQNGTASARDEVAELLAVERVIAGEGGLYPSNMVQAVAQNANAMPLRRGADDLLRALVWRGVPLTVLTPGWAPVAIEALRQFGGVAGPSGMLPPNVAVAGNFFQVGQNGMVVGFSPPLTEAACNASTAAALLGGPAAQAVRSRPNAVVLADSPEACRRLLEGAPQKTRITIGFLEVDADFQRRLPAFLEAFDVVLVGEPSLAYVVRLLESMLGLPVQLGGQ